MRDDIGTEALRKIFELLATSWVDLRATRYITEIAKGECAHRALAVNGEQSLTAGCYVLRASGKPADDTWNMVESNGVLSEKVLDDLKVNIEVALRAKLNLKPEESLEKELNLFDKMGEPVFVTLRAAGINDRVLAALRCALPTVTFFFLAGREESNQTALSSVNVEYIAPPLDDGFEDMFCNLYAEKRRYLIRR
jgi:hypothetical protein